MTEILKAGVEELAKQLSRRYGVPFLPLPELPSLNWWDCKIARLSSDRETILHIPTGTRLTQPETYRKWTLNYALIRLQLTRYIKGPRDFARLVEFMRQAWPTEPRARRLQVQLRRTDHYGRYTFSNMVSDFADAARTCSSAFDSMVTYDLRDPEDIKRYGKEWVRQFTSISVDKLGWPAREKRLSCKMAGQVLQRFFSNTKTGAVRRVRFPGSKTKNGFRMSNRPLLTVHVSESPNGGNIVGLAGTTYWIQEHHKIPPNPIRDGDLIRSYQTNSVCIAALVSDEWVTAASMTNPKVGNPEPVWMSRHYMACGSNFGISGYDQRVHVVSLEAAREQCRRDGIPFPADCATRAGRMWALQAAFPDVYLTGKKDNRARR